MDADRPAIADADFSRAIFTETVSFDRAVFGDARFEGARFADDAYFGGALFRGDANFSGGCVFEGAANFSAATFEGAAMFGGARFRGYSDFVNTHFVGLSAYFIGADFARATRFTRARFGRDARFLAATFGGDADFSSTTLQLSADFGRASFAGEVSVYDMSVGNDLDFSRASFDTTRQLGPFVVSRKLLLDQAVFERRVTIEAAATILSARGSTFVGGAHLRVRWAEIALDDADFVRPSTLSAIAIWAGSSDLAAACMADRPVELQTQPRLVTLRGAHLGQLALSSVDLRSCRFFGAHGLETLTIEASCQWPRPPVGWRYSDRLTIAEEHHSRRGWEDPYTREPEWLCARDGPERLDPDAIAALYRALRKAREDANDHPGSSDLYYGEMEMRRRIAAPSPGKRGRMRARCDRGIVTAYWLSSGYGLKASRAGCVLLALVIVATLILQAYGFAGHPPYWRAVLYSTESTSSLFRTPSLHGARITALGEWLQFGLRLLGPLLIGLALLALRARIKR